MKKHNPLDYDCVRWAGDSSDKRNRDILTGQPLRLDDRRCVVCRPRTDSVLHL